MTLDILNEKLKEFGMSEADLTLVEKAIEAKATELLEAEKKSISAAVDSLVEDWEQKLEQKASEMVEQLDEKYASKIQEERSVITESVEETVKKFEDHFKTYSQTLIESVEKKYRGDFEEEVQAIVENFEKNFDEYSASIVKELNEKHQTQSDLKVAMAEELIESLRGIYGEYSVTLPESVEFEEEFKQHLKESEEKVSTLSKENQSLKRKLVEKAKAEIVSKLSEGLTYKQREDFVALSESVLFVSEDLYESRLVDIKKRMNLVEQEDETVKDVEVVKKDSSKIDASKYTKVLGK